MTGDTLDFNSSFFDEDDPDTEYDDDETAATRDTSISNKRDSINKSDALDASEVRITMRELYPGYKEVPSLSGNVLSFLVGMHSKDTLQRFNVYLQNGTLGCSTILNDKVRECFRKDITTREALKKTLQDPPKLAQLDIDAFLRLKKDSTTSPKKNINFKFTGNDKLDLATKIEMVDVGVCVVMGEREKLLDHLKKMKMESAIEDIRIDNNRDQSDDVDEDSHNDIDLTSDDSNADDDDDSESESDDDNYDEDDDDDANALAGLEFDFSLNEDVSSQTEQCLEDIEKMGKVVTSVSTNGKACVFLYGNGGIAYTPNVPKQLYNKLKSLRTNPKASRPAYIAIGTRERYHVSFLNGTFDWKGPKSLGQVLRKLRHAPRCVAFGPSFDTFFIVYHDGSWEYQGRSIPKDLIQKLADRSERPDLVCVTLGPRGEWFLRTQNGRLWWGGISDPLDEIIDSLLEKDRYLNFLDFGYDGSYFLSYD